MTEGQRSDQSLLSFFKRLTKLSGHKLFNWLKCARTSAEISSSFETLLRSRVESHLFIGSLQATLKKKWESCTKEEKDAFDAIVDEINDAEAQVDDSDVRINE